MSVSPIIAVGEKKNSRTFPKSVSTEKSQEYQLSNLKPFHTQETKKSS